MDILECESEDVSDTPFMTGGEIEVVKTAYHVDVYEFEDVVNTHHKFEVGLMGIHDVTAVREVHQLVTAEILWQERVVLVAEGAPEGVDGNVLTPLEFLQQWDAVEDLTIHIP